MRKAREVVRLHHVAGLSGRAIARSLKLSPTTVKRYIGRADEAGLSWPLPGSLDDAQLERRLFPGGAVSMPGETRLRLPSCLASSSSQTLVRMIFCSRVIVDSLARGFVCPDRVDIQEHLAPVGFHLNLVQDSHSVAFRDTPTPRPRRDRPLKGRQWGGGRSRRWSVRVRKRSFSGP